MILVEVRDGPLQGERFELLDGDVLGRVRSCAVVVKHGSVSREHARVERDDGGWCLVDLGSVNGIRSGGRRVERARLSEGDEVSLGEVRLVVLECAELRELEEHAPAPAPRRPAAPPPLDSRAARTGLLSWDLEQLAPAARWAILALVAAAAVGVAAGAYRLAIFLRST